MVARAGANARTALVLSPPDPKALTSHPSGWTLSALAIRIDEPTTRLPWGSADPALFGAAPGPWARWADTERSMLARAWGSRLPGLVEELGEGPSVGLADADVLEFVDQVAPRLQAAGFDVIAPGGLLRPPRCAAGCPRPTRAPGR